YYGALQLHRLSRQMQAGRKERDGSRATHEKNQCARQICAVAKEPSPARPFGRAKVPTVQAMDERSKWTSVLNCAMAKGEKDVPELVRAAEALEGELVRLETLSRSVRKIHLDSEKSISRAAKELNEALTLPDRLAAGLRGLAAAMERMQARQQAALEPLAARATDIQQRIQRLG